MRQRVALVATLARLYVGVVLIAAANRFVQWRRAGVWAKLMSAPSANPPCVLDISGGE